jgi:hypothetical protein
MFVGRTTRLLVMSSESLPFRYCMVDLCRLYYVTLLFSHMPYGDARELNFPTELRLFVDEILSGRRGEKSVSSI